ncbi:MAG: precorrin-6y C5,15-methyltransferase (decarboxylating) subunit CbiE [Solirubrobacteraceae bacterium]|nr:precorrin-6y C5,15-methyltransferase (decarboxylating) subunit CbiE [Solirubrobacteraceae bacterium]
MTLTVVGIGADGWDGLGTDARDALLLAPLVVGSTRQLDALPATVTAPRRAWPSPMAPLVDDLAAGRLGDAVVLASGDPMLHSVGSSLARRAAPGTVSVVPHPSAFALACARTGWDAATTTLVSAVGRPVDVVATALQTRRRIVVYVTGTDGAATLARALCDRGFGASSLTVLERLGATDERRTDTTADAARDHVADPLHAVAVEVRGGPSLPCMPGLPDDAYDHDGQLTKRHVRAMTLAALGPLPHETLWDVGAGSGSIAIEWLRAEPTADAVAIEADPVRAARIGANATRLGVPRLRVVAGAAPDALADLPRPDVAFVGGGITVPGVLDRVWGALCPGGRLVANVVTLEGERALAAARDAHGGALVRIDVASAEPLGSLTGWRPQRPVVQWSVVKDDDEGRCAPESAGGTA